MHYSMQVLLALALVALNAFFVAAEFAAVGARRSHLEEISKTNLLARWALQVKHSLDLYLSACQLGITLASLGLGFVTEKVFVELFQPLLARLPFLVDAHAPAVVVGLALSSALHVVAGEVAPKNIAIRVPDRLLPVLTPPLMLFTGLFYPAIWALNACSNGLLRLMGIRIDHEGYEEPLHSMNEIRALLKRSFEEGGIAPASRQVLAAAFEFDDRVAKEIMTPRPDVACLRVGQNLEGIVTQIKNAAYTRYPLCEGDRDNVIGLVHMRDIFALLADRFTNGGTAKPTDVNLTAVKREILVIPDTLDVPRLLRQFQRSKIHMAAVVDEYGSFLGIVTLEDVIEELVGEIYDEFDERSQAPIRKVGNTYRVLTTAPLYQVADVLDLPNIQECDQTTLNGYLLQTIGRALTVGDAVTLGAYRVEVAKALNDRVKVVLIQKTEPPPESAEPA